MTGIATYEATAEQARTLTDRIKVAVEGTWHLITEAYTSRAWAALGYSSWDDYCTREFGTSRLRLPREERSEIIASLREAGLSIPGIAAASGLGYGTVQRTLSAPYPIGQPAADPVVAQSEIEDERALTDEECEALDNDLDEMLTDAEQADQIEAEVKAARITGTDGKSYPKPEPRTPNRRGLTDTARDAGWELRKAVDKIQRLLADDRYPRNKNEVATQLRSHLAFAVESCQGFIDQLPTSDEGENL